MFKLLRKILKNPKVNFATGIMIGVVIAGSGVYAATLVNSKNVTYDNSTSKASSTNVQDALDGVYNAFLSYEFYEFGTPTFSSQIDFKKVISSSGSNVFVRKKGKQLSVCLYRNEQLLCLKSGEENWEMNQEILTTTTFSGATCSASSSSASCNDDSFYCDAGSNGFVSCRDNDVGFRCAVLVDGTASCS